MPCPNDRRERSVTVGFRMTPEQKRLMHEKTFNKKWAIFWGVILTLMLICVIVILVL